MFISILWVILQLVIYTVVCWGAYNAGYKSAEKDFERKNRK